MSRRLRMELALCLVLAVLAVGWCHHHMAIERTACRAACEDLRECQRLAGRLEAAADRQAPERLEASDVQITRRIEQAAEAAKITGGMLKLISPEPARRIGRSAYVDKSTTILLRDVDLTQLVTLLYGLTADQPLCRTKAIRLTAPQPDDIGPTWNAEVTITQTLYDPAEPAGSTAQE